MTRAKGILIAVVCASLALPALAHGATIAPTMGSDEFQLAGTGCSLREAVRSINMGSNELDCVATGPGYGTDDLIQLNNQPYVLSTLGSGEDNTATGDLDILVDVDIASTSGNPDIEQTSGITDRVLDIHPGASVSLTNLTVSAGEAATAAPPGNQGGNILFRGGNADTLQLINVDVLDGFAGNLGAFGGGIASNNGGVVLVEQGSLISNNRADSPGADSNGGGIYMAGSGGRLEVTNSEVSSNSAGLDNGGGASGSGGGIRYAGGGTQSLTLTNAIIDGNRAAGGTSTGTGTGGGISIGSTGTFTLDATGGSISNNEAGGGLGWTVAGDSTGVGGGVDFQANDGGATIEDVDVVGNLAGGNGDRANGNGGGINTGNDLTVTDSTVSQNLAATDSGPLSGAPDLIGEGGGIRVSGTTPDLVIDDTDITMNQSGENVGIGGGLIMSAGGDLTLTDSTISGNVAGAAGAGGTARGGGVLRATVSPASADLIARSTISGNSVRGIGGSASAPLVRGGGLDFQTAGTAVIDQSTFSANTTTHDIGTSGGGGAAFDSVAGNDGIYTVTNSTFSGNTATGPLGGVGGGVATGAFNGGGTPPQVTFTHSTFAGNTANSTGAGGAGGNLWVRDEVAGSRVDLRATIVSGGTGEPGDENCFENAVGLIQSLGENIESTTPTQCELTPGLGDQIGVNPLLEPLALNAPGATQTHAIGSNSPAFNSVPTAGCPATDQRGVTRPQSVACDAGAFERAIDSTTTSVSCLPSPGTVGAASSCTATVNSLSPPGFPTGTVTFSAAGPGGSLSATTCSLATLTGASLCKVSYTPSAAGSHQITATYAGDGSHEGSTGSVALQVNPAATAKPKKCKKKKKAKKKSAAAAAKKCKKKKKKK